MTNEKATSAYPEESPAVPAVGAGTVVPGAKKPLKVLALEIDENDDPGGDPYNRTGSFCVPEFEED